MKKILLVLALVATVQIANAQKQSAAKKNVEAAELAIQNPKKAAKGATWLKLGEAYLKAYDAPTSNIWVGLSQQEMALVMGNQQPISQEQVTLADGTYLKLVYDDKDIYISQAGAIAFFQVTQPVVDNALEKAVEAYAKAYELEPKKGDDVAKAYNAISVKYNTEAVAYYSLGQLKKAADSFARGSEILAMAPSSAIDTSAVYNAGLVYLQATEYDNAYKYYKKCYDLGYYADNGTVFSSLADICIHKGDTLSSEKFLTEGFEKFPESQGILIGLINLNLSSGKSPDTIFALIEKAKANEPNNASLLCAEGNIYLQLGDVEKAAASYDKCAVVNPNYEYGYIRKGIMYYDLALKAQLAASADNLSDAEYMGFVSDLEKYLRACIEPFTKAYEITKDESIKPTLAEYLKNAYFRFRTESPEALEAYNKYDKISKGL